MAATALVTLLVEPAQAQDVFDPPNDAIVVTARRVEERLQHVPISITVFSQKQINNRNVVTASDLGTYTPSLTANSRFGPDESTFTIGGFNHESNTQA